MVTQLIKDSTSEFQLSGTINFESVPQLLQHTHTLFTNNQDVTVNLYGVEQCNSAGLALIIHWLQLAKKKKLSI